MADLSSVALVFAALASLMGDRIADVEQITSEMAVERASKCGLGPVTMRYEAELQSNILSAPNAALATDTQLRCLDDATGFGIFVELPSDLQPRFNEIREARASAIGIAEAQEWLSKRGLLDRVPKYVDGMTDDATFTKEVEQLCGPRTKGAFQSQHGYHALSPEWINSLELPPTDDDMEAMSCIMNMAAVAGYSIGFVGNEGYSH